MSKSLLKKLAKVGKTDSCILSESEIYATKEMVPTDIPSLNIALSGDIDGGLTSGLTVAAGPSRHFKSNSCLKLVSAYMKKYEDSICLFYDSEYGAPPSYWANFGIDTSRVMHISIENLEDLKFDLPQKLEQIERGEKVIIFIDSIGNLASKKEVNDALDSKSTADMTRAREGKSLWRIVTPKFTKKDIPCLVVGHTYQTMELYSKPIVSGGTGIMYSANTIFIFGRSQEKDDEGLAGFKFTINVEKSRFVKEKSKIPLLVKFDGGISKWSGILELALESGDVVKPQNGWYQLCDKETGELIGNKVRASAAESDSFLGVVMKREGFKQFIRDKYQLSSKMQTTEEDVDDFVDDIISEKDDTPHVTHIPDDFSTGKMLFERD